MPTLVDPHTYLHVIANWDGQWYRLIASHGYPSHAAGRRMASLQQNAWAFYPVFPLLVRLVMITGVSFGLAASVVSLACGAGGDVPAVPDARAPRCGRFVAALTVLALCCCAGGPDPAGGVHRESRRCCSSWWRCGPSRAAGHLVLALAGVALSLTRPIAPALVLVVLAQLRRAVAKPRRPHRGPLGSAAAWSAPPSRSPWARSCGRSSPESPSAGGTPTPRPSAPGPRWAATGPTPGCSPCGTVPRPGDGSSYCWSSDCSWSRHGEPRRGRSGSGPGRSPTRSSSSPSTPPTASVIRFSVLAGAAWWPAPAAGRRVTSGPARVASWPPWRSSGFLLQWWWLRTYFVIDPHSHGHP